MGCCTRTLLPACSGWICEKLLLNEGVHQLPAYSVWQRRGKSSVRAYRANLCAHLNAHSSANSADVYTHAVANPSNPSTRSAYTFGHECTHHQPYSRSHDQPHQQPYALSDQ